MDARQERGLLIASLLKISRDGDTWIVPSQSGNGRYRVRLVPDPPICTCPDFEKRGNRCKHIFAAEQAAREQSEPSLQPIPAPAPEAAPRILPVIPGGQIGTPVPPVKRPTYKQDWPKYNKAQTTEKDKFQALLFDLCRGVEEPERPGKKCKGRGRIRMADAVFACAFKVYSTISARRFMCDMRDAHQRGWVLRAPSFNSIFNFLDDPFMAPMLTKLILLSSLPLRTVEVDFAGDSTGFTTSRFVRWFDHKYNVVRQEHDWVKVHLMTGVKTNIVTAVEIHDRNTNDCPVLPALLDTTATGFKVREVSADNQYASQENFAAIAKHGAEPFVTFRSNITGAAGGLFEKAFHFFSFHREEFYAHYHKRSNVESTVSMIKAKFGDAVRCKTDVAMKNEALCKVLCHNICCLVSAILELGITPVFWPNLRPVDDPAVN